jgi:hypothetical protein
MGVVSFVEGEGMATTILEELFGVDESRAFSFFCVGLRELVNNQTRRPIPQRELFYVASVLAHHSLVPRSNNECLLPADNLSDVFDFLILQGFGSNDLEILKMGGSQILLFAGFFRNQMKYRHNVDWYDHFGQSIYDRVSQISRDRDQRMLFEGLSERLPFWTATCQKFNTVCRDRRFLLNV